MTSIVRVNSGTANVVRLADGQAADVVADHQAVVSARRSRPFAVARQPEPVNEWSCRLIAGSGAVIGKWLPPDEKNSVRLGAIPLLIGLGVDELSVAPPMLPQIKHLIRRLKLSEAHQLAARINVTSPGARWAGSVLPVRIRVMPSDLSTASFMYAS